MKKRMWTAAAALALMASPCAAGTIEGESRVVSVTVFSDRAGVTRLAAVTLSAGAHTVKIAPLPSAVESQSVTARGAGEAEVTIHGVRVVTSQLETAQDPRVKTLQEDIQQAARRQRFLQDTKQILAREREYLASIQAASSEQIGKDLVTKAPSASDAAELLSFLDGAFLKNAERDQQADLEQELLARQVDKLQRELADLTQGRFKQETAVFVDLEVSKGGSFQLEVSYRVFGATWQPTYEARASSTSSEVALTTYGVIRQQTGEDWTDARLILSTAKPALAGSMPELAPWFLRPWEPEPLYREAPQDRLALSEAEPKGAAEGLTAQVAQEAKVAAAGVDTRGPSVTFTLSRPESVPSDWQPHRVSIGSTTFQAALAYETTPKLLPYAFLRGKVANTTDLLFLPGPVSILLDGAFVATASLTQVAPGETFDLYLGVDERVKVERKPLKERVEVSLLPGLRGRTKSTDYEFLTTIENFTGRRIALTVFDQLPVSEREEIIVESVKQAPENVEKDPERPGVFSWALDLGPNQKEELRLSYRVRHPVEMAVQR